MEVNYDIETEPMKNHVGRSPSLSFGLSESSAKSRLSEALFRAVAADVGATVSPPSTDEDVWAIDLQAGFNHGSVNVQLKCSARTEEIKSQNHVRIDVKQDWLEKWHNRSHREETYLVQYLIPEKSMDWIDVSTTQLIAECEAYWVKYDPAIHSGVSSIHAPLTQPFDSWALAEWGYALRPGFTGGS